MLAGKRALVVGVANQRSIAWAVAEAWAAAGATVHLTCQSERFLPSVLKLSDAAWGEGHRHSVGVLDMRDDAAIERACEAASGSVGLDAVLHSVAYASADAMKGGLLATTRADFAEAHDVSAYSLVALGRAAAPFMAGDAAAAAAAAEAAGAAGGVGASGGGGGSITTLSYFGSTRVVPGYNVMGPAKACLEATARTLAVDMGGLGIRVNCLSPGPVNTLAARGISGFVDMKNRAIERAPLQRTATADEVGAAATFLASDGAASITGQVFLMDGGLSALAP
uniref:Enoyl-[acyl-carrier-protein] reductase [NADH] n=1 Tax=Florenciella parvula TaxID=236787 RepID=A0A7S2FGL5_9STRA|mmetsp:Transcript_14892/g.31237  ORF Transcript_14892/g.31237 Transcript_14892/m.31237 type:complete len:281 (+) Transcript_14892:31-873(+)|eukprot:CAMPEP_0182535714 /NCGR_PEP_ID=MMETSP1323-20130603/18582_1 /TAXON_ID=236787 /ORGANISM="Florenciella parvula, Strain RCC1693" /LENGTH=280 /DNA_ID=CAMNT_0024745881 /DNA_START=14 /DNA_END=856 /DNA_ORIENTATION=+